MGNYYFKLFHCGHTISVMFKKQILSLAYEICIQISPPVSMSFLKFFLFYRQQMIEFLDLDINHSPVTYFIGLIEGKF